MSHTTLASRIRDAAPVHLLRDAGFADELALRWSDRQRVWHGPGLLLELLSHFSQQQAGVDVCLGLLAGGWSRAWPLTAPR